MTYNQSQRSSERFKSDKIEPGTHVVFLGGIPAHVQSADVVQFLTEKFGAVEAFKMIMDNVTGKHKGYGFARFVSSEVAENARRLKFVEFQGKSINLGDAYTGGAYHSTGRRPATNVSATTRAENLSGSEYNQGVSGTNNNNNWYPGVNGTSPGAYVQPSMGVQSQANVNSVPNYPNHGMRQHMSGNPINGMNAPIPPTNNATSPQRRTVDICRYWSQGRCRKGVNCPFVHSMNENEWRSSIPPGTSMPSVPAHTMQMAAGSPTGAPMVYHGSWDGRAPVPNAMNNQQVITIPPSAHGGQHHHPGMGGYPNAYPTDVNSMPQHPPYYPYYGSGAPEAHPQNQAWATGYSYTSM